MFRKRLTVFPLHPHDRLFQKLYYLESHKNTAVLLRNVQRPSSKGLVIMEKYSEDASGIPQGSILEPCHSQYS